MKILIDEREITVSDEMIDQVFDVLWDEFNTGYAEFDETLRFGAKMLVRQLLAKFEKQFGTNIRPPKGQDPVMHLMALFFNFTSEVVKRHASLEVATVNAGNTDAASVAISITGEGEGWRQVVSRGDNRVWEDNLLEEITSASHEVVS